jgi:hypothetical protein
MKRRRRSRQTGNSYGQWQSPGHSAHIGLEVEVHYRWHALYRRRLRRQYVERRAGGDVVHIEVAPGVAAHRARERSQILRLGKVFREDPRMCRRIAAAQQDAAATKGTAGADHNREAMTVREEIG